MDARDDVDTTPTPTGVNVPLNQVRLFIVSTERDCDPFLVTQNLAAATQTFGKDKKKKLFNNLSKRRRTKSINLPKLESTGLDATSLVDTSCFSLSNRASRRHERERREGSRQ
eukprot:TRINITY_DN4817_c0_g1_i1.p2 TRINITY_DN4817_c0_g1~~TRINITY_DN4817_c0_g1_i1.p2  ORF type:complete len:113 (+),score=22.92 TRINITY_DN4817_c0_g1_i1:48-386(+)